MKPWNKTLCLLLALVLLLAAMPVTAGAEEAAAPTTTATIVIYYPTDAYYGSYSITVSDSPVTLDCPAYITVGSATYEFDFYRVGGNYYDALTLPKYTGDPSWNRTWGKIQAFYKAHTHVYRPCHNRTHHWNGCACGRAIDKAPHVDPATDADKICTCGYEFSHNANLSTLWLDGMQVTPRFDKDTTEYQGKVYLYKEVTETTIKAKAQDGMAVVELPRDLTIREGTNIFEITVTAEDTVTTKTYRITAVKDAKVDGILISAEGDAVTAAPRARNTRRTANIAVSDPVGLKLAEAAARENSARILLQSEFSKWGTDIACYTLSATVLEQIAQTTKADLVLETTYGVNVTVPNSVLSSLAQGHDSVSFLIEKSAAFSIQADGEAIDAPENISLSIVSS